MKKIIGVALFSLFVSACASNMPLNKVTMSGKPEAEYKGKTVDQVKNALVVTCNNKGFMVYHADKTSVICGKETNSTMAQILIGNAYSTPVVAKVRYTIANINKTPKVWADMWIETQMVGGQINQMPLKSNEDKNAVQKNLDELSFI